MMLRHRRREEPRIDLTSLVDVVFLLLIFFMISTTFIDNPGLGIVLPRSDSRRSQEPEKEVRVVIDRSGQVVIDGTPVAAEALAPLLARRKADGAAAVVVLADAAARHGDVVAVMDTARKAGFARLAIATDPRGAAPASDRPRP